MVIILALAVSFSGAALTVYSQSVITVSGKVYDSKTLEPLPGATVLYSRGQGTVTDENGYFSFSTHTGQHSVTFQYVGYQAVVRQLNAGSAGAYELSIGMDYLVTQMEQVVVSAGRVEQRLSDLTVSMSLIRPGALSVSHITDAQELMNKTSGIEVLDGQASIRGGSGFSYGAGSRVMVLVDGLPMLSADAGHVKWQSMPLENISQIEIIKGASSVMYGSSALNGIVNFRTSEPTRDGKTAFFAETGMFGIPRQQDWIWWDTPRMFSSASLSHQKKYGNTDISAGSFMLFDNGYRRLNNNRMGRISLGLMHHSSKVTGLKYGVAVNAMANRKRDFILWENAATGALKQDESTAQLLNGTSLAIDPSVSLKRTSRFSHTLKSRLMFTGNVFPEGGQNNSHARSVYTEYQFGFVPSGKFGLNAGLTQYGSRIISNFYGDHKGWNAAAYMQADLSPFDRLKLTAGMRLEGNALDRVYDKPVPLFRTGVNYRILDVTFLRASFGQGYRYPSIAEKHAATTLGAVKIIPNPDIEPESGWNAELAVKQGVQTGYFEGLIDLAFFYSQNKDLIEYVFGIYPDPITDEYGFGFKSVNIEHSRVYGFELEFMLNLNPGLTTTSVNGGYVFMYPVEFNPNTNKNTGAYLKFRRKHALNLNVVSGYGNFDFGLHSYVKSRILNIDDVFVNPITREGILPGFYDYWSENNRGYFLMDASVGYKISARYKVSVALKNLTNTEYMGRPGDIQPHRHVSVRISGTL